MRSSNRGLSAACGHLHTTLHTCSPLAAARAHLHTALSPLAPAHAWASRQARVSSRSNPPCQGLGATGQRLVYRALSQAMTKGRCSPICRFTKPIRPSEARARSARLSPRARLPPKKVLPASICGSAAQCHLLRPEEGAGRACPAWEQSSATKVRGRGVPAGKAKAFCTDVLMRVGALLPDGDERLTGSWRDERMRDSENSTYEAEQGSAANPAFLRRRTNTCPGNAPVQLSLATGLVQGGERGHCKGSRERPVSRDYAQVEQRGQAPLVLHSPRAWRERGEGQRRPGGRAGGQGARGVPALQGA